MDQKEQTAAPTTGLPAAPHHAQEAPPDEVDLRQLVNEYGRPAIFGLILALVLYMGITLYRYQTARSAAEAMSLLNSAQSPEQLQSVATDYPRTPSAPVALLALAREDFNAGRPAGARDRYAALLAQHSRHPMAPVARLGMAMCDEAEGKDAEALKAFTALATELSDSEMVGPQALFGKARMLERTGKADEARAIYEEFVAGHAESPWVPVAEAALEALKLGPGLTRVAVAPAAVSTSVVPNLMTAPATSPAPAAPEAPKPADGVQP